MKRVVSLIFIALISGILTLGGYKLFIEDHPEAVLATDNNTIQNFIPTNFNSVNAISSTNADFTSAAEKTINAVVHVTNRSISKTPRSISDFFYGYNQPREMIGSGSGVVISPDGYIITNYHVVKNATKLQVGLNNNKIFEAELIGSDPKTDIALIKIDSDEELSYVAFGDSDHVKIGEWVLAVGNPFNLNSTVTAGIISAKARDIEGDNSAQAYLQTDAAVNRGNSGGALVNTKGELIGINTAISSETGSYIGYSFAIPSNNAKKVINDIMEFGNVQRGILGVIGGSLNSLYAEKLGISETEGFYVDDVDAQSGAKKAGIKSGDIIKKLDNVKISKFADLSGYINSKGPNDIVNVTILRNGQEKIIPVTLVKLETFEIKELGIEIKNATNFDLKKFGVKNGVIINDGLTQDIKNWGIAGSMIIKINNQDVDSVEDVKDILKNRRYNAPIKMTFIDKNGELNTYVFK